MKYVLIICAFLAVWGLFNQYRVNYAQTQINTLQGEKKALKMQIETNGRIINAYNKKILDASKQIAELKETALESGDVCYSQRIGPALLNKLRKSRNNTAGTGKNNK